jgi:flagellar biogenesis protein FliO
MRQISGRWLATGIAVLVVVGLALYSLSARPPAAPPAPAETADSVTGLAQPAPATPSPPATTAPVMTPGAVVDLVLKLGIVALLLGGSLWGLKRFAGTSTRGGGRTGAVRIVDTLPLAQGRAFYLVDLGDRAVLVGATQQQFSALAELTDRETLTKLRATDERQEVPLAGMVQRLGGLAQGLIAPRIAARGPARDELIEHTDRRRAAPPASFADAFARAAADETLAEETVDLAPPAPTKTANVEADHPDDTADRLRVVAERLRAARQGQP